MKMTSISDLNWLKIVAATAEDTNAEQNDGKNRVLQKRGKV